MVDNGRHVAGQVARMAAQKYGKWAIARAGRTVDIIAELGGRHRVEHGLCGPRRGVAPEIHDPPLGISIGQHCHEGEFEPDSKLHAGATADLQGCFRR